MREGKRGCPIQRWGGEGGGGTRGGTPSDSPEMDEDRCLSDLLYVNARKKKGGSRWNTSLFILLL
jgi:hypothetical protein